jgi:hypothetical protein
VLLFFGKQIIFALRRMAHKANVALTRRTLQGGPEAPGNKEQGKSPALPFAWALWKRFTKAKNLAFGQSGWF